ncbi:dystroglycan-like [Dorcoceras hygrometricum]|uniref:Dystroglycan-like n=1 Tax=Dorcoceras hygrometricum TaxID=472368 RepID=A0A2Z7AYA1_9LAMI|nr:dystroglycan-like [Dorcoceras hygrometricum]
MASSFYSNSQHVDFESVLTMEDPGMVSMFQALISSGLEGFLGCPAVVFESELVDFFNNGSVKDGLVISTVHGVSIEISEQLLAETFELPVDGLSELSDMPKDKIYDARSIVSLSGEPVNLSGRKGQMKIEYRLLCDIMAKSISVKAGSFNALTVEKFALLKAVVCGVKMNWASVLFNIFKKMVTPGAKQAKGFAVQISLLLENIPNLNLGESSEFPVSKILTAKTVHRYISVTDKESTQEVADASPVKQAPKKPRASKKRPAAVPVEAPVVKKKRSLKKKSSSSQSALEMVVVAQEAIPIQIIPDTPAVEPMVEDQQERIVEQHPADEVAATAGEQEPVDEQVEEQPAVESSLEKPAAEGAAEETEDDISEKLSLEQRQSSSTSADSSSSLHFDTTDVDATVSSLPPVYLEFSAALADFQAILSEQINESQSGISSRLHKIEQGLRDSLHEQVAVLKNLFQDARQEGLSIDDVQTLRFNEFRKNIIAQNASIFVGLADVRKEVQEVNAKVDIMDSRLNDIQKNVEETKEALSHQLLEFQSQAQENQNILHAQLSELVNYINRAVLTKRGKVAAEDPNSLRMFKS